MRPLLRRTLRRLSAKRSGLSFEDLVKVEQEEDYQVQRSVMQERRAELPLDLVGPSSDPLFPLSSEDLTVLRSMLSSLLAAGPVQKMEWESAQEVYKGVRITDPFMDFDASNAATQPIQERYEAYAGMLRHVTSKKTVYYTDPERKLERWALERFLAHADDSFYRAIDGNKPF